MRVLLAIATALLRNTLRGACGATLGIAFVVGTCPDAHAALLRNVGTGPCSNPSWTSSTVWNSVWTNWCNDSNNFVTWAPGNEAQFRGTGGSSHTVYVSGNQIFSNLILEPNGTTTFELQGDRISGASIDVRTGMAFIRNDLNGVDILKTGVGTLILTGPNSFGGTLNIEQGKVTFSQGATLSPTRYILGGSTELSFVLNTNATTNGAFEGSGKLVKWDPYDLTFTGNSATYYGPVEVNLGKLFINGVLGHMGTMTVGSTATIGGNGTIRRSITLSAGAALEPGPSTSGVGTLTIGVDTSHTLTTSNTSQLNFQLDQPGMPAGSGNNDYVKVLGNIEFNAGTVLNISHSTGGTLVAGTYTLFGYGGMGSIRAVIAEDDVHQAEGIAAMVRQLRSNWLLQNLVHDRDQLLGALEEVVPDVLLLDLHMPERKSNPQSILQLVRSTAVPPIVILITGDPTKALEAYESEVADYVVKPVRPARLAQALDRAEQMLFARRAGRAGVDNASSATSPVSNNWLSGVRGRDIVLIDPGNIVYLQAERKYTVAFLSDGQALMRFGISDVESKLDMGAFLRIHRSTIVNVRRIDFLRRDEMGRLRVHMKGRPESLIVSRTFEHTFKGA